MEGHINGTVLIFNVGVELLKHLIVSNVNDQYLRNKTMFYRLHKLRILKVKPTFNI